VVDIDAVDRTINFRPQMPVKGVKSTELRLFKYVGRDTSYV
jgi:hypothetical protein